MSRLNVSNRILALPLITGLLCVATGAGAVGLERFEVGASAGLRLDTAEVSLPALSTNLSLDPSASFGAHADVNVYDVGVGNVFVEAIFGFQKSDLKADTDQETDVFVVGMKTYTYHAGVGYQWNLVRWRPYVIGTLGATTLAPSDSTDSSTDFSFAFGGGLKYQFLLNFGARLDARWYGTLLDLGQTDWICGKYDCFLADNKETLWQADISLSAYVSF